jgi:hypothetical protein
LTLSSYDPPAAPRRYRRLLGGGVATIALLLVGGAWLARQRIAIHFVDDYLAAARVPATYSITRLDPFTQRIENVRLGDPAHPDLIARRIDLGWRYGLTGPVLRSVDAEGVRLKADWRDGRLSLGAIDRLLPKASSGGTSLPDLRLSLTDTQVVLATAAGMIDASVNGSGDLARNYSATVAARAPNLAFGGCTIERLAARLAIRIVDRAPHLSGPVTVGGAGCPGQSIAVGPGRVRADVHIVRGLDRASGAVTLAGFAGHGGMARFGALGGTIGINGGAEGVGGRIDVRAMGVAAPVVRARSARIAGDYRILPRERSFAGAIMGAGVTVRRDIPATIRSAAHAAVGTPLAPIGRRMGDMLAELLSASDLTAQVAYAGSGDRQSLRIDHALLRSASGGSLDLGGSVAQDGRGWRLDGRLAGSAVPKVVFHASQAGGGPITALVRSDPYAAGGARLALAPLRIVVERSATTFATVATIDGPVGAGRIEGLTLPLAGRIDRGGAFRIGEGCIPIAFRKIEVAALRLEPARISVCGQPFVRRDADGALHVGAETHEVALRGALGSTPLTLRAAHLRLSDTDAFSAEQLDVALGADDDPTRLAIATLDGHIGPDGVKGLFAGAAGSIRHVPLALAGATGSWTLDRGALRLDGALGVTDRAAAARFSPLASGDVVLTLIGGRIDATASLREPRRSAAVAAITLRHDLGTGIGGARIDVPGITFVRNGLQPEHLTPLTLGVVANVAGTVSGSGRIDWTSSDIASSGDFATDRIDLAAAFGPVTGLSGTIHFIDLLGFVTAPHQEARIAEINPGVIVANGVAHYQLLAGDRVKVEHARWPFAGGALSLDPTTLDFTHSADRRLTFHIDKLDAASFIQQLDFPNISATGTFDGRLPMIFDDTGGRIEGGTLKSDGGGSLAYVGELSNAQLGTMGKLAFDALKAIRYSTLDISLDGKLDGEIVSRVRFEGVRQATGDRGFVARLIRNLPFLFNIQIRAAFRGLVGSAQSYVNPALLLQPPSQGAAKPAVQPADSAPVR